MGQVNLDALTPGELREIIELPAQRVGLRFETGLVDALLDEVSQQPGNLPLLEYALTALWQESGRSAVEATGFGSMAYYLVFAHYHNKIT